MARDDASTLLAVDVGNTHTVLGVFSGEALLGRVSLTTHRRLTADEALLRVREALGAMGEGATGGPGAVGATVPATTPPVPAPARPDGAILSCVVPALTDVWMAALARVSGSRPLVVGPGLRTGLRMRYKDPSEVGADRIADVVAARALVGAPVVAVDLGTTTNVEVVDAEGTFLGGVIAPGLRLGAAALSQAAARLPMVEVRAPRHAIGQTTREAMQAGLVLGEVARLDGLLDAVLAELGADAPVLLTGDDARALAGLLSHEVRVVGDLTLRGLLLLWQLNRR